MRIVSLFCEIDDFFLEYEAWKSTHCLPKTTPIEPGGVRDACIRVRWWRSWLLSIKATIGHLSTFISNTSASIGMLSFQTSWVILASWGWKKKSWRFWRFTFLRTLASRVASLSSTRHACGCVIPSGFHPTRSSQGLPNAQRPLWGGFMGSNFIWLSITPAIS